SNAGEMDHPFQPGNPVTDAQIFGSLLTQCLPPARIAPLRMRGGHHDMSGGGDDGDEPLQ
ncbi:hypothetical protein FRC11_009637, partial [Ceratobasidium sp. 423]